LIVIIITNICIKRLDSSEMDHSENEDYTMSSPLPGKKSDKRDDSDLVRVRYFVWFYNKYNNSNSFYVNNNFYTETSECYFQVWHMILLQWF